MAIVLNTTPGNCFSLHGDILFTAYESVKANDPVTYPNYKYVCDVYIAGVMIFRAKSFPNPVNKRGVFNIGPIVRNYLAQQFNPTGTGILVQEFGSGDFYLDVTCKFGEEYSYTVYTNVLIDTARRYYNHYNNQLYTNTSILPSYSDKIASNRPYKNSVLQSQTNFYVPYWCYTGTSISITVNSYGLQLASSGYILAKPSLSVINTLAGQRLQVAGSVPTAANRTGSKTITCTNGSLQQLNFSPTAINNDIPGMIDSTTDYYVVTINSVINLLYKVADERIYNPYVIHFLNQLGGFDSVEFRKLSRTTYDTDQKGYLQQPFRMDANGIVSYSVNSTVYEANSNYSSQFKKKMKLSTDIMTDQDYTWLRELYFSPLIYIQDGNMLVPVNISSNNYEEIKWINNKITSLQIDIEFNVQLNAQYR